MKIGNIYSNTQAWFYSLPEYEGIARSKYMKICAILSAKLMMYKNSGTIEDWSIDYDFETIKFTLHFAPGVHTIYEYDIGSSILNATGSCNCPYIPISKSVKPRYGVIPNPFHTTP